MSQATGGRTSTPPAQAYRGWRLVGTPAPIPSEWLSRFVGLHVLRLPGLRRVWVVAGSVDRLYDLAAHPAAQLTVRRLTVVVAWWRPPWRGWSGGLRPIRHLLRHRVSLPRLRRGVATVRLRLARPVRLREVLDVAVAALGGPVPAPAPVSADLTSHGTPPGWLPAQAGTTTVFGQLPDNPEIRGFDVLLRPANTPDAFPPAEGTSRAYAVARASLPHAVLDTDGQPVVLADARRINPRRRRPEAHRPDAPRVRLDFLPRAGGQGWLRGVLRWPGGRVAGRLDGPGLDATALAALRQIGVVECPFVPEDEPVPIAALLVQVAMTGAVLHAPRLPDRVARLLATELRQIVTAPLPGDDALALEARSVRQRRAALRYHATAFRLPATVAATFPDLARPPSVSVVLATRRPEMLPAILRTMIGQTYPELEIVVCLHGVAYPAELRDTVARGERPIEVVEVPATASFGEALGAATRRARGTLITKVDDDDSYGSEHIWDLVLARHYSGAHLVGKGAEFVYLETRDLTVRRTSGVPESDGDLVAGGTMLLAKGDLEAVGGWRPVPRSVDLGLIERLRRAGARIYRTHPFGYVYHRRATGHTWDPGERYFLDTAFDRWPGIPPAVLAEPVSQPASPPPGGPASRPGPASPDAGACQAQQQVTAVGHPGVVGVSGVP